MYRDKIEELKEWQNSKNRKPLILNGARQVGKTWLLKEFGKQCYERTVYINLADSKQIWSLFDNDFNIERIINGLELFTNTKIEAKNTLIILDEVQNCPRALESLKYFQENAPKYHIAVAGSLLGIALQGAASFPVGKVNTKNLYPMTFTEFLRATGKEQYADKIKAGDADSLTPFHNLLIDALKVYLVVGGMPEVVQNYIDEGNVLQTRAIQAEIISDYERDFAKHAPLNTVPRIQEIFHILPRELSKENKKFLFSLIKEGARAKDYEMALLWLEDAGIVSRVNRVSAVKFPLSAYFETDAFKLFFLDVGLLGAMSNLDPKIILDGDKLFTEFRGALAEQYVFSELTASGHNLWYYKKDKPTREVDFLIERENEIIPIEVKSGTKTYAKSFGDFIHENKTKYAIKTSLVEHRPVNKGSVEYLPLYMVESI